MKKAMIFAFVVALSSPAFAGKADDIASAEIGRASCRERV